MRFPGQVVVVTGGASGIGKATVELFAHEGATVVVNDHFPDRAAVAMRLSGQGLKVFAVPGDVSVEAQVEQNVAAIMAQVGRIDILINNAGGGTSEAAEHYSEWRRMLAVNLDGQFYWAQKAAVASMIPNQRGVIINVAAGAALAAIPNDVGYVTAKHGVVGLTKALAIEWARYNIRVNCVCPGITETEFLTTVEAKEPGRFTERKKRVPLGRAATADEQAEAIAFLASPAASYATGTIFNNDGGQMALFSGFAPK